VPCVFYIHGGRMRFSSCYLGNYKAWGRMIAARGVAVAMVDFRNSVHPSSAPEVAPFPAGLNDCVSGLKWVHATRTRSASTRRTSSSPAKVAAAT
jgi:acetyl esterase